MGYKYTVLVGLYDVPKNIKEDNNKYQDLLMMLVKENKNNNLLCFGDENSSGSKGLGCGICDWWTKELENCSKKFKDITFEFYLSYWDFENLTILRYKNGKQIFGKKYYFEDGIKIDETLTINPKMNYETLYFSITNNITPYFDTTDSLDIDEDCYFGELLEY